MEKKRRLMVAILITSLVLWSIGPAIASDPKEDEAGNMLKVFNEWQESKHPSTRLLFDGSIKLPDDGMCLVCHDSAGFLQWSQKGFDPEWGDDAKLSELGPAPTANCQVCHDRDAKDPSKLRLRGATPEVRGGFKADDAGSGAVCILCHNSRRGLRNDKSKPEADKRAPHEASSADVVFGENFYFVPNGQIMPHAEVYNTCAGCHMSSDYQGGGHTFKASWGNCKDCHDEVDGEAEKRKIIEARNSLKASIDTALTKAAQAAISKGGFAFKDVAEDETVDEKYTSYNKGRISGVDSLYFHGDQTFKFMVDGKKYMTTIHLIQCQGKDLIKTKEGQIIAKAGWNLYMIDHDRSNGAHNSPYVLEAVKATIAALDSVDFTVVSALK